MRSYVTWVMFDVILLVCAFSDSEIPAENVGFECVEVEEDHGHSEDSLIICYQQTP